MAVSELLDPVQTLQQQIEDRVRDEVKKVVAPEIVGVKAEIGDVKGEVADVKKRLEDVKKDIAKVVDVQKVLEGIKSVAPDLWSVQIGIVSITLQGFNDSVETATKKLMKDLVVGDRAEAIKNFIVAVGPTRITVSVQVSVLSQVGISLVFSDPAKRIEEIVKLIMDLN